MVNPRQRQVELPKPAPADDPSTADFAAIHADAARVDGMVKVLVGLVFIIVSLAAVAAGVVGLHALIRMQQVRWWALVLGVPGLLLALAGLVLLLAGLWKTFSGRGRG